MKINFKKIGIIIATIIMLVTLVGCGDKDIHMDAFNTFKDAFVNNDYNAMYNLLSTESKAYKGEEEFINKYNKVYSGIQVKDLELEINGEVLVENNMATFPVSFKMNTIAGVLEYSDYKMEFIKEDGQYYLKWNESLIIPGMVQDDNVYYRTISSSRGNIFDRNDNKLAWDGTVKWVGIHPSKFETENKEAKINELAEILDIDKEKIEKKLEANSNPEYFVDIVKVLPTDSEKLQKLQGRESEGILVNETSSRIYNGGEAVGRLLGYVAPITAEQLEKNSDYTATSLIGQAGIEQVFEENLRGIDGVEIYIKRGNEEISILKKEPVNGKDIKLSIDLGLQIETYAQMERNEGAATAVDPKTGEVLALVHSPSYDSNIYTTYITNEQRKTIDENSNAYGSNKFRVTYSPGSTMKLITASIGLDEGVIVPEDIRDIAGAKWQEDTSWGNYFVTRVNDSINGVNLKDAVKYSDNIYFAQVASEIGATNYVSGAKKFGLGDEMQFEYRMEESKLSNSGDITSDIMLADTGYGQGEVMMTPLHVALVYSALGNDGNIMNPRLVLDENYKPKVWKEQAISIDNLPILKDAFLSPINEDGGTANEGRIDGINIAGKTGTAEIKQSQDDTEGTENGWFVAVDTDTSKLSMAMILENASSKMVVPKVRSAMEYYLK